MEVDRSVRLHVQWADVGMQEMVPNRGNVFVKLGRPLGSVHNTK